jgi:hypothetical protein
LSDNAEVLFQPIFTMSTPRLVIIPRKMVGVRTELEERRLLIFILLKVVETKDVGVMRHAGDDNESLLSTS